MTISVNAKLNMSCFHSLGVCNTVCICSSVVYVTVYNDNEYVCTYVCTICSGNTI